MIEASAFTSSRISDVLTSMGSGLTRAFSITFTASGVLPTTSPVTTRPDAVTKL